MKNKSVLWVVPAVISLALAAGCSSAAQPPLNSAEDQIAETVHTTEPLNGEGQSSPQQVYNNQNNKPDPSDTITPPEDNPKTSGTGETAASAQEKAGKSKNDKDKSWNTKSPKLLGIAIGDTKDSVIALFGKADDEFAMEEQKETSYVSEYKGFWVGFDTKNKVKFVEIFDPEVKTNLNGLKVGQQGEEAIKALGKPSNHNTYTLGYKAEGAFLKLDLDPQNNEVTSIKLFVQA